MTKTEFITLLAAKYAIVSNSEALTESYDIAPGKNIKWYRRIVFEKQVSQKDRIPTGVKKELTYYVVNEGLGDEAAYSFRAAPGDDINDQDIAATALTGYSYQKIFDSIELRKRVMGFICKLVPAIINESAATPDHAIRLKLANDAMQYPVKYLDAFMVTASNNATIRTNGNSTTDSDLEWVINSEIKTVATAFGYV